MKIFYLETCPYCINARRALKELQDNDPDCAAIETEWIEESRQPQIADTYDYYRVPSVFCDGEKLYECDPHDDYTEIRRHLEKCLQRAVE
ncbi:MAG: glutaredoxin [Erysipelotrichaceae bacterium]|nr:glutaredoxin [Erysipelotrichaceae bacterium]